MQASPSASIDSTRLAREAADAADCARARELFVSYWLGSPSEKIAQASNIANLLERLGPNRRMAAALSRVKALITMVDVDHVDDLDGEIRGLRAAGERGVLNRGFPHAKAS